MGFFEKIKREADPFNETERLNILETRQNETDEAIKKLGKSIGKLGEKTTEITNRSKTTWPQIGALILGIGTILGIIFACAYPTLNDINKRLDTALKNEIKEELKAEILPDIQRQTKTP